VITQELQHHPHPVFRLSTGLIGLFLSLLWLVATLRATHWIAFWHDQLTRLDNREPEVELRAFGSDAYQAMRQTWLTITNVLLVLIGVFVFLWSAIV